MSNTVTIVGAGLAGSEAALNLASRGISVRLVEMRPARPTAVHHTGDAAELVCSNSLKSTKPDSAAGLLKAELTTLESPLIAAAKRHAVAAGGALAVDRVLFSRDVTRQVEEHPLIAVERREATDIPSLAAGSDAIVLASGPLTSDKIEGFPGRTFRIINRCSLNKKEIKENLSDLKKANITVRKDVYKRQV